MVDNFSFIVITSERCRYCRTVFQASSKISSFISLDNQNQKNIVNLLKNYFERKEMAQPDQCICAYYGNKFEEKTIYITPKYLVLDFTGNGKINFDLQLDFSEFAIEDNIRYELYAVINKVSSNSVKFKGLIKNGEIWKFFDGENIEECGNECLEVGTPSCIIYEKIK